MTETFERSELEKQCFILQELKSSVLGKMLYSTDFMIYQIAKVVGLDEQFLNHLSSHESAFYSMCECHRQYARAVGKKIDEHIDRLHAKLEELEQQENNHG